ncbi:sensor histidine kinase [Nocardioides litoris]|uniref:sensor histidine kinase n=1 Tax=Nocardioides litoris TaxID=1926648 RepID=UPI001FEC7DD9|nr:ATP-binding protein [Nocardioides litoris]
MPQSSAQDLADVLPDGVVVADADGRVTLVSTVAARMLGRVGSDDVGRPLAEVLRLQDQDAQAWTACNTPYAGLRTRTGVPEQPWLTPGGVEVLVTAALHRAERLGPVTQVVVTIRWGHGRARLDRERSDLVATVAHELRSPLTGVKGFVQALLNRWDKLNDEQKKLMLETVAADSDRLSRLIAELLDVARIDTGRLQLYPRPSDGGVLVERVVESVRAATAREIDLAVAGALPDVMVDPDKFTQVVTNLVENAVRHGDGLVTVLAEPEPHPDAPDGLRVTVSDQGEGIKPELRRRVFTKFWTGGVSGGSGLGLYIVNGLVRAHGGVVSIDDAPGGGAVLSVTWPGVPEELVV